MPHKHYTVTISKPIMKLHLSKSLSPISVSNDNTDNDNNIIDHTIGCSVGWQAATQQMREQTRTTNGVRLRLRLRFGISIRNSNGNGDNINIRVDSAPFPPPQCPCPHTHRGSQP